MLPTPTGIKGEDAGWALLDYICSTYECGSCGCRVAQDDVVLIEYIEINGMKATALICKTCDRRSRQVTIV